MNGRIWRFPLGLYRTVSTITRERNLLGLTSIIPMTFHIPVRVDILRVVLLIATNLDLFEPPLRQDCVGGSKVTPQV